MKLQKLVTAGMAVVALVTISACSDSGDDADSAPTTTTSAATSTSEAAGNAAAGVTDASKPPTAAALNAMLTKALNPDIPNKDKTDLVQGSEADPTIFDKLVKAKKDNPGVTYKILPGVTKSGTNTAKAQIQITLPGSPPQSGDAQIVYDKGRWKLAKSTVCPLLQANNVKTALCS
ncbi:hypothetical protein [Williamsia sterculiae]|uniref:Low molecular weight antigen MTB12-like C-terminal domain-containing protein n=1 Tax=Williamsia sterculiae TaxID=1344003 RepID=A0A1N7H6H5_9NOCA|nr:hypothetical protein [Williamsia sterculiae]SIS20449.1 hypothetical protein SAMN05445060_3608 [Williamsia sterculiae]